MFRAVREGKSAEASGLLRCKDSDIKCASVPRLGEVLLSLT